MAIKQVLGRSLRASVLAAIFGLLYTAGAVAGEDKAAAFIPKLVNSSTIPANGDLNPYGVAFVPHGDDNRNEWMRRRVAHEPRPFSRRSATPL